MDRHIWSKVISTVRKVETAGENGELLRLLVEHKPIPGESAYTIHHVEIPIFPPGGYPGYYNDAGIPLDIAHLAAWIASLPTRWQTNPFASWFIFVPEAIRQDQLEEILLEHSVLVHSKMVNFDRAARVQIQAALERKLKHMGFRTTRGQRRANKLGRSSRGNHAFLGLEPSSKGIDPRLLGGLIDIGSEAIERDFGAGLDYNRILEDNPANDTGEIDTVEIRLEATGSNDVYVGTTTEGAEDVFTSRDFENLGPIAAGSMQSKSGLTMNVTLGDYISAYGTSSETLEYTSSAAKGYWYKFGQGFPYSGVDFIFVDNPTLSLKGEGETFGVEHEKSLSDSVATSDSPSKTIGVGRSDPVAIAEATGKGSAAFKSDSVAIADQISNEPEIVIGDAIAIAEAMYKAPGKGLADNIGIADSYARIVSFVKALSDTVTLAETISNGFGLPLADAVAIVDSISKGPGLRPSDTIAIADALATAIGQALSDTVTIADVALKFPVHVSIRELLSVRALQRARQQNSARDRKGW